MSRGIHRLSNNSLKTTKPGLKGDGGNLFLQTTPLRDGSGVTHSWLFKYERDGKVRVMGLGSTITVSLADARDIALQYRKLLLAGIDPITHRDAQRAAAKAANAKPIMTFKQAEGGYIAAHRAEWRSQQHAAEWPASLAKHVHPTLGDIDVAKIDTALVLKALQPIWSTIPETASRLRGRVEAILDWAKVAEHRQGDNPAKWQGHLEYLLADPSKRKVEHLAAMSWREVPAFLAQLRPTAGLNGVPALALEFIILTASRKSEVRFAKWSEVDLDAKTWTVPAARMKAGKEHRVPLSARAVEILRELPRTGEFIFPGRNGPLGESAFEHLLKRLGVSVTTHGFRSAFRDWAAERTNYAHEVAEQALAHAIPSATEKAYRRGDLFEKRRHLMEAWAEFLSRPVSTGATITALRPAS